MVFGWGKGKDRQATDAPIRQVTTEAELAEAIGDQTAVIYKHSFRCGLCVRSLKEVRKFADASPHIPILMVDVVANRDLSNAIASRFEVKHESPQAIVVREGSVLWAGSHLGVTAGDVARAAS